MTLVEDPNERWRQADNRQKDADGPNKPAEGFDPRSQGADVSFEPSRGRRQLGSQRRRGRRDVSPQGCVGVADFHRDVSLDRSDDFGGVLVGYVNRPKGFEQGDLYIATFTFKLKQSKNIP
jgi:hypothetical protein